jgi:adhesin/invasin
VATFSNTESTFGLTSIRNGYWTGTWTPRVRLNTFATATINAVEVGSNFTGKVSTTGTIGDVPDLPIIALGGVVGTASYVSSPAPGTLISIFGSNLSEKVEQAATLPLPTRLGDTKVLVDGVDIPLSFVSPGQINGQLPYDLPKNGAHQLVVMRGTTISTPEAFAALAAQPAVFTVAGTGNGQGHVYRITQDQRQILAAPSSPVSEGDVLTIYASGLGDVDPPLAAGEPAPLGHLESTVKQARVFIGGVEASVLFSGLTPGFAGLYQLNAIVPKSVTPGDSVPLLVTIAGQISRPVTIATR